MDEVRPELLKSLCPQVSQILHALVSKCWIRGSEPVMWKGGLLHTIPKKVGCFEASSSRGIMLLSSLGKTFHGLVRKRILQWVEMHRLPTQLGGFRHLQTPFASLLLRSYSNVCLRHSFSVGAVFVDLKAAFHFLLRDHTFGNMGDLPEPLRRVLEQDGLSVEDLMEECSLHASHFVESAPPQVVRLAQETHQGTWFALRDDPNLHGTTRGSRPGSPLADVSFNALMVAILARLNHFLLAQPEVQEVTSALGVPCPLIAWVDDICVPLATVRCGLLEPLIDRVLSHMKSLFGSFGLVLNMGAGKTEAIVSYRGAGSAKLRQSRFLEEGGRLSLSAGGSVRLVDSYRHLGVRFGQMASLQLDLKQRLAHASSVFRTLQKPVLLNRRIHVQTRLKLLDSLVLSIVFHGAGAWPPLAHSTYTMVQHAVISWQRRVVGVGFWSADLISDLDFLGSHQLPTLSVRLAKHRIGFAWQLCQFAPQVLQTVLSIESSLCGDSWLGALKHSLTWLDSMLATSSPLRLDFPTADASDVAVFAWLRATAGSGKVVLKKLFNKYLLQEAIAADVRLATLKMKDALTQRGFLVAHPVSVEQPAEASFQCPTCQQCFTTPQGLQSHCWQTHDAISYERRLSFGVVCQSCHMCFWSSQRLQQHLRYSRRQGHGCFYRLAESFLPDCDPETTALPPHLKGIERVPAVTSLGPFPDLPAPCFFPPAWFDLDWRSQWLAAGLPAELLKAHYQAVEETLNDVSCQLTPTPGVDPVDLWLRSLHSPLLPIPPDDPGMQWAFAIWARRFLFSDWQGPWNLAHKDWFKQAFLDFATHLEVWTLLCAADALPGSLPDLLPPHAYPLGTHGARASRAIEPLVARFYKQPSLLPVVERVPCGNARLPRSVPVFWDGVTKPKLLVLHCYAGRRRPGDVHDWILKLGPELFPEFDVVPLSVDTAICPWVGNLLCPRVLRAIHALCQADALCLVLTGPPCETWSAARFLQDMDDNGRRLPRPLRSLDSPWGVAELSIRELHQVHTANRLLFSSLVIEVLVLIGGGGSVMEHPAPSPNAQHPSVWRTACHKQFFDDILGATQNRVEQLRYGAQCRKPTVLRTAGLDHMEQRLQDFEVQSYVKPTLVLGGRDESGAFRTARAKEYPQQFSRAIVASALSALRDRMCKDGCRVVDATCVEAHVKTWMQDMLDAGQHCTRTMYLPDFQPNLG
eukprot:Skav232941  [mRNA]  locus=scaffold3689:35179:38778:- [translate_table: standard]